jgi:D-glycero-D-manno-heptose 1,7-bisphosphate phosphatase
MKRAVFLDRDGTINREVDFLSDPDEVELLPGAAEAIARLNKERWLVIVVTNQSGVGRGYFTEEAVRKVNQRLQTLLASDGALIDAIYYCPHHPDAGCDCRKPATGLLRQAVNDFDIDLGHSFVAGDKVSDVEMGHRAGCKTILVLTGYGKVVQSKVDGAEVDFVAPDLQAAVNLILEEERS